MNAAAENAQFTYNNPTTFVSVVDTDDAWKAEHALEPLSDRQEDMAAQVVDKKTSWIILLALGRARSVPGRI